MEIIEIAGLSTRGITQCDELLHGDLSQRVHADRRSIQQVLACVIGLQNRTVLERKLKCLVNGDVNFDIIVCGQWALVPKIERMTVLMAVPILTVECHSQATHGFDVRKNLIQAGTNFIQCNRSDQCEIEILRKPVVQSPNAAPAASLLRRLNLRPHDTTRDGKRGNAAICAECDNTGERPLRQVGLRGTLREFPTAYSAAMIQNPRTLAHLDKNPSAWPGLVYESNGPSGPNRAGLDHFGRSGSAERAHEGRHVRRATTRHVIVARRGQEENVVHPFADPGRA